MGKNLQGASSSSGEEDNDVRARSEERRAFLEKIQLSWDLCDRIMAVGGGRTHEAVAYPEKVKQASPAIIEAIVQEFKLALMGGVPVNSIKQWIESESQNFSAAVVSMLYEVFYSRVLKRPVSMESRTTSWKVSTRCLTCTKPSSPSTSIWLVIATLWLIFRTFLCFPWLGPWMCL